MKKIFTRIYFAVLLFFPVFGALWAQADSEPLKIPPRIAESWVVIGFEYGNFFDFYRSGGQDCYDYYGAPGVSFSSYNFNYGKPYGFFLKESILFPVQVSFQGDGQDSGIKREDLDLVFKFGIMFGPAFRFTLGKTELYLGPGFNMLFSSVNINGRDISRLAGGVSLPAGATLNGMSMFSLSFGLGLDFGAKIYLDKAFFINIGASCIWNFAYVGSIDARFTISGTRVSLSEDFKPGNFNGFSAQPYLSIGFDVWSKVEGGYGKAPVQAADK